MSLRQPVRLTSYRGHVLTDAPAVEPVTEDALRDHLRETDAGLPDSEAEALIAEARQMIEEHLGCALITQSWKLVFDQWPASRGEWWDGVRDGAISELYGRPRAIEIPRWPLQSLDAVTVYDGAGNSTAVDVSAAFDVDTYQRPGRIGLKQGATWPIALRDLNGVEIDYTAGFGDAGGDVSPLLLRAVKQVAAYLYTHRGDDCTADDALSAASSALSSFRVARL